MLTSQEILAGKAFGFGDGADAAMNEIRLDGLANASYQRPTVNARRIHVSPAPQQAEVRSWMKMCLR